MTWIGRLVLISLAGALVGFVSRRHPLGRGIFLGSTVVFVTLMLVFGDEFLSGWR